MYTAKRARVAAALLLFGAAGCGPNLQPVHGKVTYPDGQPVTEGIVVFESDDGTRPVMARAEIQSDGTYVLGTFKPGDGVPPRKYRVLVAPKYDANAVDGPRKPPPIDPRFSDLKTSGLEFEVKSGANEFPITVTAPPKVRR